jgi:hypothetical protein
MQTNKDLSEGMLLMDYADRLSTANGKLLIARAALVKIMLDDEHATYTALAKEALERTN